MMNEDLKDEVALALAHCPNLEILKLRNAQAITSASIDTLVGQCPNLISADFSGCKITDDTLELLLRDKPRFHSLEIDSCECLTAACIGTNHYLPQFDCFLIRSLLLDYICQRKSLRLLSVSTSSFINALIAVRMAKELNELLVYRVRILCYLVINPFSS